MNGRKACDVVAKTDVESALGGSVAQVNADIAEQCTFSLASTKFGEFELFSHNQVVVLGAPVGTIAGTPTESLGSAYESSADESYVVIDRFGEIRLRLRTGDVEVLIVAALAIADPESAIPGLKALADTVVDTLKS